MDSSVRQTLESSDHCRALVPDALFSSESLGSSNKVLRIETFRNLDRGKYWEGLHISRFGGSTPTVSSFKGEKDLRPRLLEGTQLATLSAEGDQNLAGKLSYDAHNVADPIHRRYVLHLHDSRCV